MPPNATLQITLEVVSWKTVSDVTKDKKVLKKILKEGEGYEKPNDGAVVQGNMIWPFLLHGGLLHLTFVLFGLLIVSLSRSETNWEAAGWHCFL